MTQSAAGPIFTIGHSSHSRHDFICLLVRHGIDAVCDVRSKPYSGFNPQFNRPDLKIALRSRSIHYVFLGTELGARSEDPFCYENGKVQYSRIAQSADFLSGIQRLSVGMQKHRIVLMCAEKEPLECHRTILVARHLFDLGLDIQHIHADGHLESQGEAMQRLMRQFRIQENHMFRSHHELLVEAYDRQQESIAYTTSEELRKLPDLISLSIS